MAMPDVNVSVALETLANSMDFNLIQWPAMLVTVVASWLVASNDKRRRNWGFWTFLLSNALWIIWGIPAAAWALVVLQMALAAMNIRGALKTDGKDGNARV